MKSIRSMILTALAFVIFIGSSLSVMAQQNPAGRTEKAMLKLRVARPTDNLQEVVQFYRDGLGLDVLASFEDHKGFDGVMLGRAGLQYHLEFTHHRGHKVGKAPSRDNLLVFYIPEEAEWKNAVERMKKHGYQPVESYNPYWDDHGKTFEDVDGYRVVLQNTRWPL
ncbi:MAG: VOC family protein [Pyrinomonadaceae bacterium]